MTIKRPYFDVQKRKTLASFLTNAEPEETIRFSYPPPSDGLTMAGIDISRAKVTLFDTHD